MDCDADSMVIPATKRRAVVSDVDESYYAHPTNNKLNTLYTDCLMEIVPHLAFSSLVRLLQTGNKMLFDKITRNVTILMYIMSHKSRASINDIMRPVGHCTKLTRLYIGKCSFEGTLSSDVSFPPTLVDLVIEQCPEHAGKNSTFVSNASVLQTLPNLTRLKLDCFSMREYPIDLSASPLLTRLSLSKETNDKDKNCQDLIDKVTQLTSLRLVDCSCSDCMLVDCSKLVLVKKLVMISVFAENVHDGIEQLTMDNWDMENHFFDLFPTTTLLSLTKLVLNLVELDATTMLPRIAKIAPMIESLLVNVYPEDFTCNIWTCFAHLKTVDESLCFDPKVWPFIPKGTLFGQCSLNCDGPYVWEASDWFKTTDAESDNLAEILHEMPPFRILSLEEDCCTDEFLLAIPEKVLAQVESLYIRSTPVAQRLASLATSAKIISADFYNHLIDFSLCKSLQQLSLECTTLFSESCGKLLKMSIQTAPTSLKKLHCYLQSAIATFPPFEMSILERFKKLAYFSSSMIAEGTLNNLPLSLKGLRLYNKTSILPEMSLLMNDPNRSSLNEITLVSANDLVAEGNAIDLSEITANKEWKLTILECELIWRRAEVQESFIC